VRLCRAVWSERVALAAPGVLLEGDDHCSND